MARSRKPSVWIEKRRASTGATTYRVRAEKDGERLPDIPCGPSRDQAVEKRDALRAELWGRRLDVSSGRAAHTVGELRDAYLAEARREKAAASVAIDVRALGRLVAFFGAGAPVEAITADRLRVLQRSMTGRQGRRRLQDERPIGKTTEKIYLSAIRAAVNRARRVYRWLRHDPFEGVTIPKLKSKGRLVHEDEFQKMRPLALQVVRGGRSLWEVLDVMRHQGLRSGAVCALDGRMVDRAGHRLHLVKPARLGIGREAELKNTELFAPVHPAVWPIFAAAPAAGLIFAGWHRVEVARELRRILVALGLPHFRPHDMKHTFVTNFLKGGGTLAMAAAITGTTEETLKRVYSHLENRIPPAEMLRVSYGPPPSPQVPRRSKRP